MIAVKVLVDVDACPVVDMAVQLCKQYHVACFLLCDTSHVLHKDGAVTLIFDKGADSVDFALVNRASPGDIVITQDYGLASMCLSRTDLVLHQDGWRYSLDNISGLMEQRHIARKHRASGGRFKGPPKRTKAQDLSFYAALEALLQTSVHG